MADLDNKNVKDVEVGIIGGGSMGGGMTMLFSQHGATVGFYDYDPEAVKRNLQSAVDDKDVDETKVHGFSSLENLLGSFREGKPRIIVFSLPHGGAVDKVLGEIGPLMTKGDVILDGGNEWWESTERRQKRASQEWGLHYIGCGVSGGYQAARRGPSMSPGGDKEAYAVIKPYLEKWAAKTPEGESCVGLIGPGGAGHYVKMLHNGIEQGCLSIICEVRSILHDHLGLDDEKIAEIFKSWSTEGELRGNFLIDIGYKGLRFTKGDGIDSVPKGESIVEKIEDKVTQDSDNSEGTGVWTVSEVAVRHVAAPAICAAHQLRIISSERSERMHILKHLEIAPPGKFESVKDVDAFVEDLRQATYHAILSSFVQGLGIISKASSDQKWNVNLSECIRIWRAGCIIKSDAIADFLQPLLAQSPHIINLLLLPEVAKELQRTYAPLKKVCALIVEYDGIAPALSASLEYIKAVGAKRLPTSFEELELDYFGHHNYDTVGEDKPGHEKGKHHTEFAPA